MLRGQKRSPGFSVTWTQSMCHSVGRLLRRVTTKLETPPITCTTPASITGAVQPCVQSSRTPGYSKQKEQLLQSHRRCMLSPAMHFYTRIDSNTTLQQTKKTIEYGSTPTLPAQRSPHVTFSFEQPQVLMLYVRMIQVGSFNCFEILHDTKTPYGRSEIRKHELHLSASRDRTPLRIKLTNQ